MTKKRCKIKLVIVAILTLIGLFLTFASFVIPTTNTTFKGFFNAINYGYDINGGALSVYEVNDDRFSGDELGTRLQATVNKLNNSFNSIGLEVTRQGDQIRVQVSNGNLSYIQSLYSNYKVDILSSIGAEKGLTFSSSNSDYKADGFISGDYVESCSYGYYTNTWGITVNFTEEGKTLFKELTQNIANGTAGGSAGAGGGASGGSAGSSGGGSSTPSGTPGSLYMFFDGELYGSGFEMESGVSSLTLTASNQQAAMVLAMQINALAKPVNLKTVYSNTISSGLSSSVGAFFGNAKNLLITAFAILLVASIVFMCVRYRMLGLLATLSLAIFVVVYSFLLQSIPLVLMDFNGVLGVLFTFGLLIAGFITVFEKIRSEYLLGKKIPNSVNSGFKKCLIPTLEKYVFGILFSAVLYIVGTMGLKAFAVNVFVGLFVNYFIIFAILQGVCKLYLPVNSTKGSLYNLTRKGGIKDEI